MDSILQKIHEIGIVPVVKIDTPEHALPLGEALMAGDLPLAEITFRTDAAAESIRRLSSELPDMLVGAGTVLTPEQAKQAVKAGAKFIVSPGFNEPVVDYCLEHNIPITPGINSPTQVERGLYRGLHVLKFFPAEASGGLNLLKAMSAPYNDVMFIPTGGMKTENMNAYLSFSKVLAIGGSWMVKPELISGERFGEISRISREAVMGMLGFSLERIRMHAVTAGPAGETETVFQTLGLHEHIEMARKNTGGGRGEIAVGTNSIRRAAAFLRRKGTAFEETVDPAAGGASGSILLKNEIEGFKVRLYQR